jgi:hypothetical protein
VAEFAETEVKTGLAVPEKPASKRITKISKDDKCCVEFFIPMMPSPQNENDLLP